jgi:uncharacterized protein (DUF849 family)
MTDRIWRMKACLNGQRQRADHPAVPVTPAELAADAQAVVQAGAEAVHVHPRGSDGSESLRAADVGAAVAAVRAACPAVPVGVTTAMWITGTAAARQQQVAAWAALDRWQRPDFASVNVSEDGWQQLAGLLAGMSVRAEAGVWSEADADAAAAYAPPGDWLRILVEVPAAAAARATAEADAILARLQAGGSTVPVLLHGEDDGCWPLIRHAGRLGLATRIGLEDVLAGPDGRPVAGNASLVRLALAEWAAASPPGAAPGSRDRTG